MTGPVDECVDRAHHLCVDVDPTSVPGLSDAGSPITSRRHSRRGVLGLFLGAAALIAVDRQSAFAEDAPADGADPATINFRATAVGNDGRNENHQGDEHTE